MSDDLKNEREHILKEGLRLLREKYPTGLYEYLYKHRPEAYKELLALEDRIDQAFLWGSVEELKSVLREYWKFHIRAIREFKSLNQVPLNLQESREQMNEERIRA